MEISEQESQSILESCLRSVLHNPDSLEQVLSNFPEHEAWLRPELLAGIWLAKQMAGLEPRPEFIPRTLEHLLGNIRACQEDTPGQGDFLAIK